MLKLVGVAAVLACGAFYSYSARKSAFVELEENERALALFHSLKNEIADYGTPLWEFLSKNGVNGGINGYINSLSPALSALLADAIRLGRGYRNEELRLCEALISRLEARQKELAQKARDATVLARVKGYGMSAAVIILLL